jgi:hypothetical protein
VVYLKIFCIGYFENIVYDTDLAERVADSLAIRAFLGYDLTELPPDHSSISRVRARVGKVCDLEAVLRGTVEVCIKRGLVGGREGVVDASLVPANASLSSAKSLSNGTSIAEHLREVTRRNRAGAKEPAAASNREFRSTTDPDARLTRKPGTGTDLSYKVTQVIDSQNGIIVAAGCERADVGDAEAAEPLLEEAVTQLQAARPEQTEPPLIVADAGYDAGTFHAAVEAAGGAPLTNLQSNSRKPAGVQKQDFSYDTEQDAYRCPNGCWLRRRGTKPTGRRHYVSHAQDCAGCRLRAQCCSSGVRHLSRELHEQSREQVVLRARSDAGRKALARRKQIAEPSFGHMKTYGGLRLINSRGLAKATVKTVLAAVAQNLLKLVRAQAAPSRHSRLLKPVMAWLTGHPSLCGAISRLLALRRSLPGPFPLFAP